MKPFSLLFLFLALAYFVEAQIPNGQYQELEHRLIGPFRAGRTVGAVGIPTQPNVFFIGVNNGGVWKTDDYGRTWAPIFDDAPTGSVGDIAVSPSQPEVIYVGTGEGLHRPDLSVGDGMFKSTDGGKTWQFIGLEDIQQVARVVVHPTNPEEVFVAGLGHPYGPNEMRGVFKTQNGGRSWQKVLYINQNTGASQVEYDPGNPNILYAVMWEHREGPWENAAFSGPNSGLYKSTDGGNSWEALSQGLPGADQGLGRIGIGISASDPNRLYATVEARQEAGIYRSDNAGRSWYRVSTDGRIFSRGSDFAEIRVHPNNPDIVYSGNISAYRSEDGGYSWTAIKGAPGGDDYHRIWINPLHPEIMLFGVDQGATITVNGGKTWSSWYNQPTAQLYHIATDNQFPYWVYGGQQESGAIAVASRGNGGQITFREVMGVGADEYAFVAPDPTDPNIIFGGRLIKFNKRTGQPQFVGPETLRSGKYRTLRSVPLMFHPAEERTLLFATNVLWKSTDGAATWEIISPDLTRSKTEVPESIGDFRTAEMENMAPRGVIYAIGPSPLNKDIIWAGTDEGLVHVTRDGGKTWKDVSPSQLKSWDKVSIIEASHFDENTAYLAVNSIRKDDMRPHIFKTTDGGLNWEEIVTGMHEMGPVNVVREDPVQPGLLFSGTEREVYFSVDAGAHWQSLRRNMPASSIRDLVIHENDLVIGTHGRSIWIMDNISPLRELASLDAKKPHLFAPADTYRVRFNMFTDTPLPPEEPAGQNPPDGAPIDYYLPSKANEVLLEILTAEGDLVRRYSSKDKPLVVDSTRLSHPTYWIRPDQILSAEAGHRRFIWDLRYQRPAKAEFSYPIAAIYRNTAPVPKGPLVHPGRYIVRLQVDGQTMESSIEVLPDPRITASASDLEQQRVYAMRSYKAYLESLAIMEEMEARLNTTLSNEQRERGLLLRGEGNPEEVDIIYGRITATPLERENLVSLQQKLMYLISVIQGADERPSKASMEAVQQLESRTKELLQLCKDWLESSK
jgi:photosystem II stability/assembly factor-like uncharacterized protein